MSDILVWDVAKFPDPRNLLVISNEFKIFVTIKMDGTLTIHEEGGDKEAARLLYESLRFEGQTLAERIQALEAENAKLRDDVQYWRDAREEAHAVRGTLLEELEQLRNTMEFEVEQNLAGKEDKS